MRALAVSTFAFLVSCAAPRTLDLKIDELPNALREEARPIAASFAADPNDACALYQVATIFAEAGRHEDALEALRRMAALGTGADPRPRDFESIATRPEFQQIVATIRAQFPPVRRARESLTLPEGDLVAEGVAWSNRTKRLYLGSVKRKIIAVDREGQVETFVAPETGGLGVVLGIRVDDVRGELWATSGQLGGKPEGAVLGLLRFRLHDGELLARYPVGEKADGGLNDVAIAPDGSAYATQTAAGSIVRVDPKSGEVKTIVPPGSIAFPNGITLSTAGDALYVASWRDIYRVDLPSMRVRALAKPRHIASGCFDGLYAVGRDLVGIQNCVHATGRVVKLQLDPSGLHILEATVLESYNPLFEGVTTGAIVGDELYFVANVQFRKYGRPDATFDPLHVLAVPLGG